MNNKNIDRIIYKNILEKKPIDNLIKMGLDYSFLAKRYEDMLKNEEVIIRGRDFILTKLGEEKLTFLEKNMLGNKFIEPLNVYRKKRTSKNEVFLPKH